MPRSLLTIFVFLALSLFPSVGASETVEELAQKLATVRLHSERIAVIDQILGWERTPILGMYQYPDPKRRYEYLSLLFSDAVMTDVGGLHEQVGTRLRTEVTKESWRAQIKQEYGNALARKDLKRLKTVLPLYAFVQGYADGRMGGPNFAKRMDNLASDMTRAGLQKDKWVPEAARGILSRAVTSPREYQQAISHPNFANLPITEARVATRLGLGLSMAKPAVVTGQSVQVPITPVIQPIANTVPAVSTARQPSVETVSAPVVATVTPLREPEQKIEDLIQLIERLQLIEREIAYGTTPSRVLALTKEADELFAEGVKRSRVVFRNLERGDHPPINHTTLRSERNEFSSTYLTSLRERYFLPFLYGHFRGQIAKEPVWETPRSSALAAVGLSAAIFHSKAKTNGPAIANSIAQAREAYLADPDPSLTADVSSAMKKTFDRAHDLYVKVGKEDIIGPERSERSFQMRGDHLALMGKLPTPPFEKIDENDQLTELQALERTGSMEVFLELLARLSQAEEALKRTDLSDGDRKKIQSFSDHLYLILAEMGDVSLSITGDKTGLSSASAARRIFRETRLPSYFRQGESPRVVAAAFYGLSGTVLRHQGLTSPTNLERERTAAESLLNNVAPEVQINPEVVDALNHVRLSHGWVVPPKTVPSGPYRPLDPDATAVPKPEAIEGRSHNAPPPLFLPVDWRATVFLDQTHDPEARRLLEALATFWPRSPADATTRKAAFAVLKDAHPNDLGLILTLADTLRANRLQSYTSAASGVAPDLSGREKELQTLFRRWTREYRDTRRAGVAPTQLSERLLNLGAHVGDEGLEALHRVERELIPRLNRMFNISGDPPLIEASSRALTVVHLGLMRQRDRESALSTLRGALNHSLSGESPFTAPTVRILRNVYERLGGRYRDGGAIPAEATAEPAPEPAAVPAVVTPPMEIITTPRELMTADQIRSSLNVLSGKATEQLSARVKAMVWDDLLNESLERGIKDEKAIEALVEWIKDPNHPLEGRTQGLRILFHSWDHLRDIYKSNQDLGESVDELIGELGNRKNPDLKNSAFAEVMQGFKRVRLGGESLGTVIQDVARNLNCHNTLEAFGRSRFTLGN